VYYIFHPQIISILFFDPVSYSFYMNDQSGLQIACPMWVSISIFFSGIPDKRIGQFQSRWGSLKRNRIPLTIGPREYRHDPETKSFNNF